MGELVKIVNLNEAEHLRLDQQNYLMQENKERGYDAKRVAKLRIKYYDKCKELGLTASEGDMLCWYLWIASINGHEVPNLINFNAVAEDYKRSHEKLMEARK